MDVAPNPPASHNRVALDKALIDRLPEVVEKAAHGLANANVTVLNGAEGLSQVASGLVSQGVAIFDAIRNVVIYTDDGYDEDTAPPISANSDSRSTIR